MPYTATVDSVSAWEAVFMLVVLKIPMVYLAVVVWWAIRAEPIAGDDGEPVRALVPLTPCGWDDWRRRRSGSTPAQARAAPRAASPRRSQSPRMSTVPEGTSDRTETVAGFLCAFSFTLSGIALARTPGSSRPPRSSSRSSRRG